MSVEYLDVTTRLDLPVERVLQAAIEAGLARVIVLGNYPAAEGAPGCDGPTYMAASIASGPDVVWLLELCKHRLLKEGCLEFD